MKQLATGRSRLRGGLLVLWTGILAALVAAAPSAWLVGGVAWIAAAYAITSWTALTPESLDRTVRAVWLVPVAAGLLAPALVGVVVASESVVRGLTDHGGTWPLFASVVALCAAALGAALRWPARWPGWSFLLVTGTAALVVKLAYVAWLRMDPVSDFNGMWRLAGQVVEQGPEAVFTSESHLLRLHFQRGLPYLLPLRFLFGPSRWAYVIPNCLLTVAISLIVYRLARRFFDARAARVSFVLSLLAVEPVLASGIPTHDIPGAFLTLLALLLFLVADDAAQKGAWARAIGGGLGLGLLLPVLDLQRNTSTFLIASFSLFLLGVIVVDRASGPAAVRTWKRLAARAFLMLVLPLAVAMVVTAFFRTIELRMDRELDSYWQARAIAAHTDSWSSGRYRHAVDEYYERFDLDAAGWRELAIRKLTTDLVRNPEARLAYVLRKSVRVFDLGSQLSFYVRGATLRKGGEVGRSLRREIAFVNRTYLVVFLTLFLVGAMSVWRDSRLPLEALLPALYLTLFLGPLLLLFQAQPRYAFQTWYIGAIYAGAFFRQRVTQPEET